MAGERDPLHPRLAHEETLDLVRAATEALAALIDSGALKTKVEGLTFDPDVDIGDVHLLDTADARIDPATEGGNLAAIKAKTDNLPADPAREGGRLATIVKEHTGGARTPAFRSRATAINETPVSLATSSTPYVRAWVQAQKPGSAYGGGSPGGGLPGANTGNVYISEKGETHYWILAPGASVELPPCCNLYDFDLTAATGGDGVVVMYET